MDRLRGDHDPCLPVHGVLPPISLTLLIPVVPAAKTAVIGFGIGAGQFDTGSLRGYT